MKELYFIRHGQTEYNFKHMVQGRGVDSSLNELGRTQGQAFFNAYQDLHFDAVFTSTLKRTIETVKPFIQKPLPHERFAQIDEISWGIYEGRISDEKLHEGYKNLIRSWKSGDYSARIEGGDSAHEMVERISEFIEHIKAVEAERLLICTHGGVMAFSMALLQGEPPSEMHKYRHANTGLCKFLFDGNDFHLELLNDTSHLEHLT